jgi:hypothetical protein
MIDAIMRGEKDMRKKTLLRIGLLIALMTQILLVAGASAAPHNAKQNSL